MLLLLLLVAEILAYLCLRYLGFRAGGIAFIFFPTLFVALLTGQDARLRLILADPLSRYAALRSTSVLYGQSPIRRMFDTSKQMQPQIRERLVAQWGYKCHGPGVGIFEGWALEPGWYSCHKTIPCTLSLCICSDGAHSVALHMKTVNDRLSSARIVYYGCNTTLP